MGAISYAKSTLDSWSNSNTITKNIVSSSAQGAAIGGVAGTTVTTTFSSRGFTSKGSVTAGGAAGATLGANVSAIKGACYWISEICSWVLQQSILD